MGVTRKVASVRLQALRIEAMAGPVDAPKPLSHYFAGAKPKQALKAKSCPADSNGR